MMDGRAGFARLAPTRMARFSRSQSTAPRLAHRGQRNLWRASESRADAAEHDQHQPAGPETYPAGDSDS